MENIKEVSERLIKESKEVSDGLTLRLILETLLNVNNELKIIRMTIESVVGRRFEYERKEHHLEAPTDE